MKKLLAGVFAATALFGATIANAQNFRYGVDPDGAGPATFGDIIFDSIGAQTIIETTSALPAFPLVAGPSTNINLATYIAFSNRAFQPADSGAFNRTYTVRIAIGNAFVGNTDFVEFNVPVNIQANNFVFENGGGNGSSVLTNEAALAGVVFNGNTAVTNTPVSLQYVSYDALDALQPSGGVLAGDPLTNFNFFNDVQGFGSSLTFRVITVPEPGTVALFLGLGVSGALVAVRRRR